MKQSSVGYLHILLLWFCGAWFSFAEAAFVSGVDFGSVQRFVPTESAVNHLESDLRIAGNIIFSDGSSLKTTNGIATTTIAGLANIEGYQEGLSTNARFSWITGFVQISNVLVVVTDYKNHCLRQIDRSNGATSTFFGKCGSSGFQDGTSALFNLPWSVIADWQNSALIVADNGNNALRIVNLNTKIVSTITQLRNGLFNPSMAAFDNNRENLYITNKNFILRYSEKDACFQLLTGRNDSVGSEDGTLIRSQFSLPVNIIPLQNHIFAVSDQNNHKVRIVNLVTRTVGSICSGKVGSLDGDIFNCQFTLPRGLLSWNGRLYIGQFKAIRQVKADIPAAQIPSFESCQTTTTMPDVNECAINTHRCSVNADCINAAPGYACKCRLGFRGDGFTCTDINECTEQQHTCDQNSNCVNTSPGFSCMCKPGFTGNGFTCSDINECATSSHVCHVNAECINTSPGHTCVCKSGYAGNGFMCQDVDECSAGIHGCHGSAVCTNQVPGFICSCLPGYTGDGKTCQALNQCATRAGLCSPNAICINQLSGYTCMCKAGFTGDGVICSDINECATSTHGCHMNAECINTSPGHTCVCKSGYAGDGSTCSDINECATSSHGCHINAECINTSPGHTCVCKSGYAGNGFTCQDVDECSAGIHGCHASAACTNQVPGFTCSCLPGYTGDGKTCQALNQCGTRAGLCGPNAVCVNQFPGYTCICKAGFTGDGVICSDMNECATSSHGCHVNAECINTSPGHTCVCKSGYAGDGRTCSDINECATSSHGCHVNAECINTSPGHICVCKSGYAGDGRTCSDINECLLANCSVNADCVNLNPGYKCSCRKGFSGDGFTCQDVNECITNLHGCHINADCLNTAPGHTCRCRAGFTGNGQACIDIDECVANSHRCHMRAICVNTAPGYTCRCMSGFTGDGFTCLGSGMVCPENKTIKASESTGKGLFDLDDGGRTYKLELPLGVHSYTILRAGFNCTLSVKVVDPRLQLRLDLEASYSIECSKSISNNVLRSQLRTVAEYKYPLVEEICPESNCKKSSVYAIHVDCQNDVTKIKWPTTIIYPADTHDTEVTLQKKLSSNLQNRTKVLDMMMFEPAIKIYYPILNADSIPVTVSLYPVCSGGREYDESKGVCMEPPY